MLASTIQFSTTTAHRAQPANRPARHDSTTHPKPPHTTTVPETREPNNVPTHHTPNKGTRQERSTLPHHPGTRTPPTGKKRAPQQWLLRKEVIQPHLPVRLPCYDLVLITDPTFDGSPPQGLGHRLRVLPTFMT